MANGIEDLVDRNSLHVYRTDECIYVQTVSFVATSNTDNLLQSKLFNFF